MSAWKLSEISSIKFCTIIPNRMKTQEEQTNWLSCANFSSDNIMSGKLTKTNYQADDNFRVQPDDIVIIRISPTYVNYISEIDDEIYAGNNLIVVTPNENIYPKYLAMILNEEISSLSEASSIGAVMKSISRSDIESLPIPKLDYQKQIAVGNLWFDSIECKKMKTRLVELENIKTRFNLLKYVRKNGGKNND